MSTYAIGSSPNLILQLKPRSHFFNNTQRINQKHRYPFKTLGKGETCSNNSTSKTAILHKGNTPFLENFFFSEAIFIIAMDSSRVISLFEINNATMLITCRALDIIYDKEFWSVQILIFRVFQRETTGGSTVFIRNKITL